MGEQAKRKFGGSKKGRRKKVVPVVGEPGKFQRSGRYEWTKRARIMYILTDTETGEILCTTEGVPVLGCNRVVNRTRHAEANRRTMWVPVIMLMVQGIVDVMDAMKQYAREEFIKWEVPTDGTVEPKNLRRRDKI